MTHYSTLIAGGASILLTQGLLKGSQIREL
jgi:hypothetical protein